MENSNNHDKEPQDSVRKKPKEENVSNNQQKKILQKIIYQRIQHKKIKKKKKW
jgi:hypothetical protein